MKAATKYFINRKAEAEAAGDAVKAAYFGWKADPRGFAQTATDEDWSNVRIGGIAGRDRNAENAAERHLGFYVGD